MKYLLLWLFFLPASLIAQTHTISGYVKDAATGEVLIGANVYDLKTLQGTASNRYGFFSLTLPADSVFLRVSFVGYHPFNRVILLHEDMEMNVELQPANELEELVIHGEAVEKIEERSQMSSINLPIRQIKSIPAFLGEVDVLKAVQLLPGVQSGNEGSSGIFVRGGSPDQNLILLDGVPVYNVSHLFGFFSVFNADAINNVELIKGGFPARYGGRLSSVLDITMKEGNRKKFSGSGSIGVVASKLTLEGPLVKDKGSFIVSGRRTYLDLLARPFIKRSIDGNAGYYFYDFNVKANCKLGARDRLYLSGYFGLDDFYFKNTDTYVSNGEVLKDSYGAGLDWGNRTAVLRWNHQFAPKLFSNLTLNYSRYQFNTRVEVSEESLVNGQLDKSDFLLRYFSGISDWGATYTLDFIPRPSHYLKFGGSAVYHTFKPGTVQLKIENGQNVIDTSLNNSFTEAFEYRLFIEDDWRISELLKVNAGVHLSSFYVDREWFYSIEPRLSLRFMIADGLSLKASYSRMNQYIHLLTNSGIGLPTDLWVPATPRVIPEQSWQVATGLAKSMKHGIELSVEAYYKSMNNIIEYREGANFLLNSGWESQVVSGRGWSYGGEFFLQKKSGKTTGWIAYTLSWTYRQFEDLNFGKRFPFKYDRRHDISITIAHRLNESWQLAATWVYGTGNAISLPLAVYKGSSGIDGGGSYGLPVYYYPERNNYRMRPYHRLDLGANYSKKTSWGQWGLNIGAYNVYNRKNPFFIYEGLDELSGKRAFKQVSLFPIIPSIALNFEF